MRIGFLVNDVATEHPRAATTVLAHCAASMGHEVYLMGVADLTYDSGAGVRAVARRAPDGREMEQADWLARTQGEETPVAPLRTAELDVLYLRYNPNEDPERRPWEPDGGMMFGQAAVREGTLVLSDPFSLPYAYGKMYLESFPAEIRPVTIVTRRYDEVARFHEEQGGRIVLKPLRGYGGQDVYLVGQDAANLRQIVASIGRYSYVMAQEYLPAASEGDTRLFLFNGKPLFVEGKCAALRRVSATGDFRSNLSLGARPEKAEVTPRMLEIAELVRPRLVADGIFDAGLDIVGDKLVEINTISSGGLNAASHLEGVRFGEAVVRLIERKVELWKESGRTLSNREIAALD